MRTGFASIFVAAFVAGLVCVGCAPGPSEPQVMKELPPPPRPPGVPKRQEVPLNQSLRLAAKQEIRAAFASSDPIGRANAVEAAQDTFGDDAREIVTAGLADNDPGVRFAGIMAAGKLRFTELHDKVLLMADDPNPHVRIATRYALHRMGDFRRTHDLEKFTQDPDARVREQTAFVLGLLGEKSAVDKVLQPMSTDNDADVRIAVAEAMWRLGDVRGLDLLVTGTVSRFADDRMLCIMGLVGPRDERVARHVVGQLTDDYEQVRLVAARAMGELGSDVGYGVAMGFVKSPDPRQRALAAIALGSIGRSDSQNLLAPLLKDADAKVRVAAATALLELRPGGPTEARL